MAYATETSMWFPVIDDEDDDGPLSIYSPGTCNATRAFSSLFAPTGSTVSESSITVATSNTSFTTPPLSSSSTHTTSPAIAATASSAARRSVVLGASSGAPGLAILVMSIVALLGRHL